MEARGIGSPARLSSLVALLLLLLAVPGQAAPVLRYTTTTQGGLAITGNTLGLSKATGTNDPGTLGSIGTFVTTNTTLVDGTYPAGTTSDWTQNSSSAVLDIPGGSQVLYAELIWGGSWAYGTENVDAFLNNPVSLTMPTGTVSVSSDPETRVRLSAAAGTGFNVRYYVRSADVTAQVRTAGSGTYTVGGVPATQADAENSLNAAGWTLIVVYGNPSYPARNMTVWVDGNFVDEQEIADTTVSGFCAPPSGPVFGRVSVSAMEGDAALVGDQMLLAQTAGGTFVNVSAPNNPQANFFAAQINTIDGELDSRGTFGSQNHDAVNGVNLSGRRQSWDLTAAPISSTSGHLVNGQQSAVIRATSTVNGDSYVVSMLAFEIDVNAPSFDTVDAAEVDHTLTYVGDTLDYTVRLANEGTADAEDVVFYAPLKPGMSLVANSFRVDGAARGGVTTADLAAGVALGEVGFGDTVEVTFEARIDALPAPPGAVNFAVQPRWDYTWRTCPGDDPIQGEALTDALPLTAARLEVTKTLSPVPGPAGVAPHDVLTYTITVRNSGTAATTAAELRELLPEGLTYRANTTRLNGTLLSDTAGTTRFAAGSRIATPGAPAGVLRLGETATITLQVVVDFDAAGELLNRAQADPDGSGPAPFVEVIVPVLVNGDVDGDTLPNAEEDLDGDGDLLDEDTDDNDVPNFRDLDDDGDGLDTPTEDVNGDGDLWNDDTDDDDVPNFLDPDDDGDQVDTVIDNCPFTPNDDQADADEDGVGNACQGDFDGDGEPDETDNCPSVPNPGQTNTDGEDDGGDACDTDDDEDGVIDAADNCPLVANADQANMDNDLAGDACDEDIDGDGLDNELEEDIQTDPRDPDTDGDGLGDGVEVDGENATDPRDADTDGDGLCDGPATVAGDCASGEDMDADGVFDVGETNPNDADTDDGSVPDGTEREVGTDPLDPSDDVPPVVDTDGDGLTDQEENDIGTNPNDPDTDGDGLWDGVEVNGDNMTDPTDADSDDDRLCDGPATVQDICETGEDTSADGTHDSGETDPNDADSDDGTVDDGTEVFRGTNPLDPTDDVALDGDDDGDGDATTPEACGCSPGGRVGPDLAFWMMVLAAVLLFRRKHLPS